MQNTLLQTFATLLVFQTIGEVMSYALRLPVPGPVIGMVLMLLYLRLRPRSLEAMRETSLGLLQHLSLLFVPAGVGVMAHWHRLAAEGVAIVVAIIVSTVLALAATALTVRALLPKDER
ncbi:MAG: CidA/LrgA family protein [Burkholderiales bacterium]|jgi:holin-like protein|nr:CidA/LrgA family protein [Burkholderiales bacterium]